MAIKIKTNFGCVLKKKDFIYIGKFGSFEKDIKNNLLYKDFLYEGIEKYFWSTSSAADTEKD